MVLAALLLFTPDLADYRAWSCVTPQAVDMAPQIALLCVGPASWDASKANPHVRKRFKVWVNPIGRATMADAKRTGRFPEGSILVKEKYDAATKVEAAFDGKPPRPLPATPELLTIMVKGRRGSKPKTGDWSYYVADGLGKRLDGASEARCAGCHAAQSERDFTFRSYQRLK